MSQAPEKNAVATWRKVLAAVLDFLTIFIFGGYVIGYLTGSLTPGGFQLRGGPAFALVAAMIAYFIVFTKYLGGTPWQRVLKVR